MEKLYDDILKHLIVDALASALWPVRNLLDQEEVWRALERTGIRPSLIGDLWDKAVEKEKEKRDRFRLHDLTIHDLTKSDSSAS